MIELIPILLGVLLGLYLAELGSRVYLDKQMKIERDRFIGASEQLGILHNETVKEMTKVKAKLESHDGYINSVKMKPIKSRF